ncbi:MAG TPA: tetratricopeptide repeat protein, partial [Thermomicrobiales bacterium]
MAKESDQTSTGLPPEFGVLLRRLRSSADLTQEELAERAGVSARLVSDLERGAIQRPRRDTVRMLADGLHLSDADREAFAARARGYPTAGRPDVAAPPAARRGTLPLPPNALVGRDREVAAVTSLLMQPDVRLVTLVGPGGVGKTRLALDVAFRLAGAFPDGVWFVDLAPVTDPALVLPSLARTLGVQEGGVQSLRESLVASLVGLRLLVVLDNVEHLIAAATVVGDLLAACAGLTILATSRQPLRLRIEREYLLAPLALPDLERLPPAADLAGIPAVALFVRQAEAARRAFAVTEENARTVAEIAVRLDGLPLAIELAAARTKILTPAALLVRLEHRLPLLTSGAQDLPARQQTLRATLDWSHDLLDPDERALFRRLAVFAGGFALEAAEAIGAEGGGRKAEENGSPPALRPPPSAPVLDGIASLVDKNLLRPIDHDEARFGLLETMREYGLECLVAAGEEEVIRHRHAVWCLALAEEAEPHLRGPDQETWLRRLDRDVDNLRAALDWVFARRDGAMALRLCAALWRFWTTRGDYDEGRRWLERALVFEDGVPTAVRAKTLRGASVIAYRQGDYRRAEMVGEEARALYAALGDRVGVATSLITLGHVAHGAGDRARAEALNEEALALCRALDDRAGAGMALNSLGMLAWERRDFARAAVWHEEALTLRRALGDDYGVAYSLANLGFVASALGDYERAELLHAEALELRRQLSNKNGLAESFDGVALLAAATGQPERAAHLLGAAEAVRTRIGAAIWSYDRASTERCAAELRARLGDVAFAAAR